MNSSRAKRSPNVLIRGQAAEEFVETVWNAWCAEYPEHAGAYKALIMREYENLHKPSGVSKEGNLAYTGHIPAEIFYAIEAHHFGFFNEPGNMDKFYRIAMGQYRPKCSNNFHYIDRRESK